MWWEQTAYLNRYGKYDSSYVENMTLYDTVYALKSLEEFLKKENEVTRMSEDK